MDLSAMSPEQVRAEAARRTARRAAGLPLHDLLVAEAEERAETERASRIDTRKEKAIQSEVYKILRAHGCEVYWLSQPRRTMQTAGVPDLIVFHVGASLMAYFECKGHGGVQSPAQEEFERVCEQCGIRYVMGGVAEARALVNEILQRTRRV